jgi:glycosyltransferase involved in cell wall biosynthesis
VAKTNCTLTTMLADMITRARQGDGETSPGPTLSLVMPCFNEADALTRFFEHVPSVLDDLDVSWEIIAVNDGSLDDTLERLLAAARRDGRVRVVDLSRNFGKEAALTAGLDTARGQAVVPIDVDLQDPPELIGAMLAQWRDGYDVVYAVRRARGSDTRLKRVTANLFYRLYNRMTTVMIPPNAGDFRLLDRRVVEVLKALPERNRFMKGLFAWLGFRQTAIAYDRPARAAGASKFSYWKLWNFALDGLTSFTTVPLRIWTYIGGSIAALAFLYAAFLILRTLIYGVDVPGYASIMVVILFLGGVQLISLGIIGEYLGRTYDEVKARPIYLVDRTYEFTNAPDASGNGAGSRQGPRGNPVE